MIVESVAVGYLIAWVANKARRVGERANTEVDWAIDTALDQLHNIVADRLSPGSALTALEDQVTELGGTTVSTRTAVEGEIRDAAVGDPDFAERLQLAITKIKEVEKADRIIIADNGATAVGGDSSITADHGSIAGNSINAAGGIAVGARETPTVPDAETI